MIKRTKQADLMYFLRNLWWQADDDTDRAATELLNRILYLEEKVEKLNQEVADNKVISTYK